MPGAEEPAGGSSGPHGDAATRPPLAWAGRQVSATLRGCRHPIVVVLLLISFFAAISGKPLDGVLMLVVAIPLARDAGLHRPAEPAAALSPANPSPSSPAAAPPAAPGPGPAGTSVPPPATPPPAALAAAGPDTIRPPDGYPAGTGPDTIRPPDGYPAGTGGPDTIRRPDGYPAGTGGPDRGTPALAAAGEAAVPEAAFAPGAARRKWLLAGLTLAGGALYAVVVGSFTRYSWPATTAVVAVGAIVVGRGWRGPVLLRPDPGPLPRAGAALWSGVLVAGGLWELFALLRQPSLTASSYAHPTISTLTDPLLAGPPGRALVLAAWLALGWALVRR